MVSIKPGSAATAAALTLFGAPGSSTTNRLRIALAVKGLPYKFEKVDMGTNESRSEEYRQTMNRLGQIPILQVGAIKLRQTVAQLEFLEEVYPQPPLLPEDPIERARVREIVEIVNSFIQPMQNKLTVEKIAEMDSELAEWLPRAVKAHVSPDGGSGHEEDEISPILWPHWWIIKGFDSIEGLIDVESDFCCGNQVTLADCALVPQVVGAKKYQVDLTLYPNIRRVYNNVITLGPVREGLSDVLATVK